MFCYLRKLDKRAACSEVSKLVGSRDYSIFMNRASVNFFTGSVFSVDKAYNPDINVCDVILCKKIILRENFDEYHNPAFEEYNTTRDFYFNP